MRAAATLLAVMVLAVAASPTSAARQDQDIVDTATAAGDFTTLTKLLKRAGLVNALKEPGPYTVFAPTDAAFAKVPAKKLDALLESKKKLRSVLLYHVVGKRLTAAQVVEPQGREDPERQEGPLPRPRLEGVRQPRARHDRRRRRVQRRHPRDQPRPPPPVIHEPSRPGGRARHLLRRPLGCGERRRSQVS